MNVWSTYGVFSELTFTNFWLRIIFLIEIKMKLPFSKDEDGKRMMSGTSTGRKELIYEARDTSLIGGNATRRRDTVDKAVQSRPNMDIGSGDTSDCIIDVQSSYGTLSDESRFNSHANQAIDATIYKTHVSESSSILPPPLPLSSSPTQKSASTSSSESIDKSKYDDKSNDDESNVDHLFKGKEDKTRETKNSTLAMVEDNKQPSITANESNPTVPSPKEPSKTSTWLADRKRSESEDDIEKMEEPEQMGTIAGHKALYKTTAATEGSPNSEKMDKNGNRSDNEQNESDNECIVQCLYYTLQCCECVIF